MIIFTKLVVLTSTHTDTCAELRSFFPVRAQLARHNQTELENELKKSHISRDPCKAACTCMEDLLPLESDAVVVETRPIHSHFTFCVIIDM